MMQTLSLETLVSRARNHKMAPAERRAQRVSLIMGLRGNHSTLTRKQVEGFLENIEGHETVDAPNR